MSKITTGNTPRLLSGGMKGSKDSKPKDSSKMICGVCGKTLKASDVMDHLDSHNNSMESF